MTQKFTIEVGNSFKFISSEAVDKSEVFTAIKDCYHNGYIVIDSHNNPFILYTNTVVDKLDNGTFKIVSDDFFTDN
jgi:hypothetical protein